MEARLAKYRCSGVRALAHNFSLDERLSPERADPYRLAFQADRVGFLRSLTAHHRRYLAEHIEQPANGLPETFDSGKNRRSLVPTPHENQDLVRVETLDWILDDKNTAGLTRFEVMKHFDALSRPVDQRPEATATFLDSLIAHWNSKRDQRPMFAAFADDVRDDAEASGDRWLHRLRARLGLSHITPWKGQPILGALMRYSVKDVLDTVPKSQRESQRDTCFAVPTVLDGPLNPYFYPAPSALRYGRALNLNADPQCDGLTAEVLHRRIDYRPDHLKKIVEVRSVDSALHSINLITRRNEHLGCLRRHPGCESFGTDMS